MKYILILSPIILTVLLVVILFFVSSHATRNPSLPFFSPTPTSTPFESVAQKQTPLSLISSHPNDQTPQTPTTTTISLTFNREPLPNELSFSSVPQMTFTTKISNNTVTLVPSKPLAQDTTYYIFALPNNGTPAFSLAFTTVSGQPQAPQPTSGTYLGSGSDNTVQTEDQLTLKQHPDIFIYNRCPYTGGDFSVMSDFADTSIPHYFFSVTLSGDINTAKQDFISWLLSLGLTSQQIRNLDIRYQ